MARPSPSAPAAVEVAGSPLAPDWRLTGLAGLAAIGAATLPAIGAASLPKTEFTSGDVGTVATLPARSLATAD